MGIMKYIGDAIDSIREWAFKETNTNKAILKGLVAGFVDDGEYVCLIIGNVVCIVGSVLWIGKLFHKNKEDGI